MTLESNYSFPIGDALAGAVDARRWSTPNIPAAAR